MSTTPSFPIQKVDTMLTDLEKAISWCDKFLKKGLKGQPLKVLKQYRRDIKRIKYAVNRRPSAAMYGESQVGKSYLINNLLALPKQQLTIVDPGNGREYDYLEKINPAGGGTEATSVVTRFTSKPSGTDPGYPVLVHLLSPKDVVLFILDSYFYDIVDHQFIPNAEKIRKELAEIAEINLKKAEQKPPFSEDDIFEIKDYLKQNFRSFTGDLLGSDYWDFVASIIERIPYTEWTKVFSFLWGKNEHLNSVFEKLIHALSQLDFSEEIGVEFRSVLRKHGTLLDVTRLKELEAGPLYLDVENKSDFVSDVAYRVDNEGTVRTGRIDKSLLCALTAEVVFNIDPELEKDKPFLDDFDLLDFPGARGRLDNKENNIEAKHMGMMILRGKVSYIFNKYSAQYLINNLLLCNKNQQINVTYISSLLNTWIENYIGKTPEERELFLRETSVSPLFVIYTFFNADMSFDAINDNADSLDKKWVKRFIKIFQGEIVTKNYTWDRNWTTSQPYFQNNYLLRDFHYSKDIYSGFGMEGTETGVMPFQIEGYLDKLEKSFLDFPFVQDHFRDPVESWREAANKNKDGSELIIRNLSKVRSDEARNKKFIRELNAIANGIREEMAKHYHSDDLDMQIKKSFQTAGKICIDMDVVFGRHPYAFGRFIKQLTIREGAVYNQYKELLNSLQLPESKNTNEYILIRQSVAELSLKKTFDENLEILKRSYGDNAETDLIERGISLQELFYGDGNVIKKSSVILAEALRDYWFAQHLSLDRYVDLMEQNFHAGSLEALFENMRTAFDELGIIDIIAQEIREYVDRYDKVEEAIEMISDISSGIINKFITSLGSDFYSRAKKEQLETTAKQNDLDIDFRYNTDRTEFIKNEAVAELFDNMDKYDEYISAVTVDKAVVDNFPNIHNIARWRELMKMSFIANCDIPTYDPLANTALKSILEELGGHQFSAST